MHYTGSRSSLATTADHYTEDPLDGDDCFINQPVGGIAFFNPSGHVNITSCIITDNIRGLFVFYNNHSNASFVINDTSISSNMYSSLIMTDNAENSFLGIDFLDVDITDHFETVVSSVLEYTSSYDAVKFGNNLAKIIVQLNQRDGDSLKFSSLNDFHYCHYSTDQPSVCYDDNGYSARCPPSYYSCLWKSDSTDKADKLAFFVL